MTGQVTLTYRIYPCPLPHCDWELTGEPPGPVEGNETFMADIFGMGVMAVSAKAQRLQSVEQQLSDHLITHPVQDYAIALALANKRIAELESHVVIIRDGDTGNAAEGT